MFYLILGYEDLPETANNSNTIFTTDYLNGLHGATFYFVVKADIYNAALHHNFWKGRRLILE